MEYHDRTLQCRDCGKPFIWTVGEQAFYVTKGLVNEPARCPECRAARKARLGLEPPRVVYAIVCAECGTDTTVPFIPRNGRPVLCATCFSKVKPVAEEAAPVAQVVQVAAAEAATATDTAVAVAGD